MTNMNERFRSVAIKLSVDPSAGPDGVPKRVQVLRVGTFLYQDESMEEPVQMEISREMLQSMVRNFNEKIRGVDLAMDYGHKSGEEAAGWFTALFLDGDELWADIDWTKEARAALSDKKFRYVSADFNFDYQDNETGKKFGPTLNGAGLTNRPFVKNMAPAIALTEGGRMAKKLDETTSADGKKKKTDDDGDGDGKDISAQLADLQAKYAEVMKENAELKKSAMKHAATALASEKKSEFDVMLSEGKVCEAQREPFMEEDMKAFLAAAKKVNLSERGHGERDRGGNDGSGDEMPKTYSEASAEVQKRAKKLMEEKKATDIGAAYSLVFKQDRKLSDAYQRLYRKAQSEAESA